MSDSMTITANIVSGGTITGDIQDGFTIFTDVVESSAVIADVIAGGAGPQGAQGIQGPQGIAGTNGAAGAPGAGFPSGGLTDQILAKLSSADFDTHWIPQAFEQSFSSASVVTVTHNLGRYPSVTVFDTANDECFGDVEHLSVNQLAVTFSSPFDGKIICN